MVRHDANGAMGLVVNDPIRDVPLATVFEQAGLDPAGVAGTIHLHAGGPVQRTRFFVLHTDDYAIADTLRVGDGLAVTSHIDILRAVAAGTGPRRTLFVVGYATLSEAIKQERIQATLKNGVLQLRLPKAKRAKPRQIAIQAE